jgi:hypothetical protein
MLLNYLLVIINYWVRVGCAAILHNGVIVPGVFTEEQYNCALCKDSLG